MWVFLCFIQNNNVLFHLNSLVHITTVGTWKSTVSVSIHLKWDRFMNKYLICEQGYSHCRFFLMKWSRFCWVFHSLNISQNVRLNCIIVKYSTIKMMEMCRQTEKKKKGNKRTVWMKSSVPSYDEQKKAELFLARWKLLKLLYPLLKLF